MQILGFSFRWLLNNILYHQVFLKYVWNWQIYTASIMTAPILQQTPHASCMTGCKQTVLSSLRTSAPKLSGCFHWTISWSLRWLMSWKSPCRQSGKSFQKNTQTRWWQTPPSAWLPVVATSSVCSNSVHLQVCFLIASPIDRFGSWFLIAVDYKDTQYTLWAQCLVSIVDSRTLAKDMTMIRDRNFDD